MSVQLSELNFSDLSTWVEPVSDDSPCGKDLEYDERYISLLRDIAPPSGGYDASVREQQEPEDLRNWRELKNKADDLSSSTKSLGLVVAACQIFMNSEARSVEGMMKGLFLVHHYVTDFWECIYPALDADDEDPHYSRYSALANLGDWKSVVLPLKRNKIILSIGLGEYTLEDILALDDGKDIPDKQPLDGLMDDELGSILQLRKDFQGCLAFAEAVKNALREHTGEVFDGFDKYLIPCLKSGAKILPDLADERAVTTDPDSLGSESVSPNEPSVSSMSHEVSQKMSVKSRDDVEKAFELICEYYTKYEPSSPVPLLVQRAQKLVRQDFRAILDELRLGGSSELEQIFGRLEE